MKPFYNHEIKKYNLYSQCNNFLPLSSQPLLLFYIETEVFRKAKKSSEWVVFLQ